MKVFDVLLGLGFEMLREVDHGGLTIAGLSEVLRAMLEIVVGSASTAKATAAAGHLDEGAVDEPLRIVFVALLLTPCLNIITSV